MEARCWWARWKGLSQRLCRLLKKSEQQIPRGLKAARDDKNRRLIGTTEVVPCYKALQERLFRAVCLVVGLGDAVAEKIQRPLYGRDSSLLAELVGFAAPKEPVAGEAGDPGAEAQQIAQRIEPAQP